MIARLSHVGAYFRVLTEGMFLGILLDGLWVIFGRACAAAIVWVCAAVAGVRRA